MLDELKAERADILSKYGALPSGDGATLSGSTLTDLRVCGEALTDAIQQFERLREIYRRIQAADSPDLKLPVEMSLAMAEMTALLAEQE